MPTLTLQFKDNVISTHTLEKGQSLTIGRKDDNYVVIENLAVSGHHCKIDSIGDGFVLTDLQSKNGSFVNENMVQSHWLKDGDVISIGKHNLVFSYGKGEVQPKDPSGEAEQMDQTMVMDTSKYRDMLEKSSAGLASPKAKKEPVGVLSYLGGGEGEIELSKKLIKIGKDSGSDIVVSGLTVGATAATISKRPNGYHLSYVGGLSKPKVNDTAVKQSVALKDFDIIELGSVKLQFFTKE